MQKPSARRGEGPEGGAALDSVSNQTRATASIRVSTRSGRAEPATTTTRSASIRFARRRYGFIEAMYSSYILAHAVDLGEDGGGPGVELGRVGLEARDGAGVEVVPQERVLVLHVLHEGVVAPPRVLAGGRDLVEPRPGVDEAILAALAEGGVRDRRRARLPGGEVAFGLGVHLVDLRTTVGHLLLAVRDVLAEVLVGSLEVLGGHLGDRVVGRDGLLELRPGLPDGLDRALDRLQELRGLHPVPPAPRPGSPAGPPRRPRARERGTSCFFSSAPPPVCRNSNRRDRANRPCPAREVWTHPVRPRRTAARPSRRPGRAGARVRSPRVARAATRASRATRGRPGPGPAPPCTSGACWR